MGNWIRVESRRNNQYAKPTYYWQPDDEFDAPGRSDMYFLQHTLKGRQIGAPVDYDDRAGEPKRINTTGGGYKSGGPRQSYAFHRNARPSTPDRDAFASNLPEGREYFDPENVQYTPNGSPYRLDSPGGTGYDVGPGYSGLYMVHPTYDSTFGIDMYGSNMPGKSKLPRLTITEGSIQLTPVVINSFSCTRKENGANLYGVMSNQSAKDAALGAGIPATGDWAWLHLIAYTMGGPDGKNPDVPENLVAGTSESNIYHLAIESAAKKLVLETGEILKVSWKLEGRVDPDWHIAERIEYRLTNLNDPGKTVTFPIKTLEHQSAYGGDTNAVYSYLKNIKKICG